MSKEPIVSIIVPVYNPPEERFACCVRSLLGQTLPPMEILLVDDGSGKAIRAACDRYAAADARLRVIHQPNAGVSAARNRGIEEARGEYLAFVDADDEVEPDYAQTLLDAINGHDLAICAISDQAYAVKDGACDLHVFFTHPETYSGVQYLNFAFNKLFRTGMIREYGIQFEPSVKRGEDALFVADYLPHCASVRCVSRALYRYRVTTGSAMRTFDKRFWLWERQVIERAWALFTAENLSSDQYDALLGWLYGKIQYTFFYYLDYDVHDIRAVNEIRHDPFYGLLLEQTRRQPLRSKGRRGRRNLWLWRTFGVLGVRLSHFYVRLMKRLRAAR